MHYSGPVSNYCRATRFQMCIQHVPFSVYLIDGSTDEGVS
jgi:hypothetical protein